MGQQEVLNILKKNNKLMPVRDIAIELDENPKKIFVIIKKLLLQGDIISKELDVKKSYKLYKCKRRMHLYKIQG